MSFKKLNYNKLMEMNPTVYDKITNQLGQEVELVEHPLLGDSSFVIAVIHKEQVAFETTFFDCEDFFEDSEYNPLYKDGVMDCAFNFNF